MEYKYKEHPDYNQIQVAKISWSTKKKMSHKAGHSNHKLWRRNAIFDAELNMLRIGNSTFLMKWKDMFNCPHICSKTVEDD